MNSITRDYSQLSSFARSSCIAYSLHIRGGTVLQFLTLTAKRTDLLQHMQLCVQSIRSSLVLEHSLHLVKVLSLACPCSGTNISNQKIKCCLVLKWVVVPVFFKYQTNCKNMFCCPLLCEVPIETTGKSFVTCLPEIAIQTIGKGVKWEITSDNNELSYIINGKCPLK